MLSSLEAKASRPRPPASNRRSTTAAGTSSSSDNATTKPPYHRGGSMPAGASNAQVSAPNPTLSSLLPRAIEADLDLDLPPDLTAALGSSQVSNRARSRSGKAMDPYKHISSVARQDTLVDLNITDDLNSFPKSRKGAAVGRKLGPKVSNSLNSDQDEENSSPLQSQALNRSLVSSEAATQNTSDGSSGGSPISSPKSSFAAPISPASHSKSNANGSDQGSGSEGRDSGEESGEDYGYEEVDQDQRAYVENLPRNDLEALLLQAHQVIRERERDLNMAATIGKALLEKTLEIRSKNDGRLMPKSRPADEEVSRCSPPTTDTDLPTELGDSSLKTPIPTGNADGGYFDEDQTPTHHGRERPQTGSLFQPSQALSFPSSTSADSDLSSVGRQSWQGSPPRSLYSHSQPRSPSIYRGSVAAGSPIKRRNASGTSFNSELYKAQVENELASLQADNDAHITRMLELQADSERIKREGGKQLRTLQNEIDSLQKALDDASERNAELEAENVKKEGSAGKRKVWRRKAGRAPELGSDEESNCQESDPSPNSGVNDRFRHFPKGSLTPALARSPIKGQRSPPLSRSSSISGKSDISLTHSAMEAAFNEVPRTAGEQAIIARLIAKVQELEEANAQLSNTQDEINGRFGSIIEEGVRISDAFDAVRKGEEFEQSAEGDGDFDLDDGATSASASPARARRALGNRYRIETRRTIRSALKTERKEARAALSRSGTLDSLTSNSASFSQGSSSGAGSIRKDPRRRASASSLGRPRIRITPSAEDLASRHRSDSRDLDYNSDNRYKGDSLKPSDALSFKKSQSRSKRPDMTAMLSKTLRRVISNASFNGSIAGGSSFGSEPGCKPPSISKRKARYSYAHDGLTPGSSYASDLDQSALPSFVSFETTSSIAGDVDSAALRLKYGYGLEEQEEMRVRTLGSELGSVFGGDGEQMQEGVGDQVDQGDESADRSSATSRQQSQKGDLSLSMSLSELHLQHFSQDEDPSLSPSMNRLALPIQARRRSTGSLAESTSAVSDIGNMAFSVSSKSSTAIFDPPSDVPLIEGSSELSQDPFKQHGRELTLQAAPNEIQTLLMRAAADGEWTAGEDILPRGALRDGVSEESQNETYESIDRATRRQPVFWADDDDFGKPITESEAKRIGLMETGLKVKRSLLGWRIKREEAQVQESPSKSKKGKAKGKSRGSNPLAIETADQVEERESLTSLLRLKRAAALQARAEMNENYGRNRSSTHNSSRSSSSHHSLDSEVNARALAIASAKYRRISRPDYYPQESSILKNRTVSKNSNDSSDTIKANKRVFSGKNSSNSNSKVSRSTSLISRGFDDEHREMQDGEEEGEGEEEEEGSGSSSEEFELVDLDPARRRPGRRGTDYFPVATAARYRPAMVRQRVNVASNEAITWAVAWIGFATVMIFAFCVAFSRGPKRVLGTSAGGVRQPGPR